MNEENRMTHKIMRSKAYPRYSLEEALTFVKKVDKLGAKDVAQKSVLAELDKNSPNDPIFSGLVSSAKQFDLLHQSGNTYSISDRARLLIYPTPETNQKTLLAEAFQNPEIYNKLIARFQGKEVPPKKSLGNILLNEFGISKNAKNRAASVFMKSAEYAGLLSNGRLALMGDKKEKTGQENEQIEWFSTFFDPDRPPTPAKTAYMIIPILIDEGEVQIRVPKTKISTSSLERIKKILSAHLGDSLESGK